MDKRYKIDRIDDDWCIASIGVFVEYLTLFGNKRWRQVFRTDSVEEAHKWIKQDKEFPIYV